MEEKDLFPYLCLVTTTLERVKTNKMETHRGTVLFGLKPENISTISPDLKARGIELIKTAPFDFRTINYVDAKQPLYSVYQGYFSAYVSATLTQKSVKLNASTFAPVQNLDRNKVLPFSYPPLGTVFKGTIRTEDHELLDQYQRTTTKVRSKEITIIQNPDLDLLKAISSKCDSTCFTPYGSANLDSLRGYDKSLKLLSTALWTHAYPAFSSSEHFMEILATKPEEKAHDLVISGAQTGSTAS